MARDRYARCNLTKTERAILNTLLDGEPHHRLELKEHMGPSSLAGLRVHVCNMRPKLAPLGEDIVCILNKRTIWYRLVRTISSPNAG